MHNYYSLLIPKSRNYNSIICISSYEYKINELNM